MVVQIPMLTMLIVGDGGVARVGRNREHLRRIIRNLLMSATDNGAE